MDIPEFPNLHVLSEKVKKEKKDLSNSRNLKAKVLTAKKDASNIGRHAGRNLHSSRENTSKNFAVRKRKPNDDNRNLPTAKRSRPEDTGKPNWREYKVEKKNRLVARKKCELGIDAYDSCKDAKNLWEDLRRRNCTSSEKAKLSNKLFTLLKSDFITYVQRHDMSRVIETMMSTGTNEMRETIINIYKENPHLCSQKYSKHVILKALRNATADQRKKFCQSFYPYIALFMVARHGRELAEFIFESLPTETHRVKCVSSLYSYKFSKNKEKSVDNCKPMAVATEYMRYRIGDEHMPLEVPKSMQSFINKMLHPKHPISTKYHVLHMVLLQYFLICTAQEKDRIIEAFKLRENIADIVSTKAGANLCMQIFWQSTAKERKAIIKVLKGKFSEIACMQYGHSFLFAILDSMDDTTFLAKAVCSELMRSIDTIMGNQYGRRVINYLVAPRNKMDLSPQMIQTLETGCLNSHSKKDSELRQSEIRTAVMDSLLDAVIENVSTWLKDGKDCLVVASILSKYTGPKHVEAIQSVVKFITDKETCHCIENGGTFLMLKKLIGFEAHKTEIAKEMKEVNLVFTQALIEAFEKHSLENWIKSISGSTLLLGIFEVHSDHKELIDTLYKKIDSISYEKILKNSADFSTVKSKPALLMFLNQRKKITKSK